MTAGRLPPADRLPTLTEVVELGQQSARTAAGAADAAPEVESGAPAQVDIGVEPAMSPAIEGTPALDEGVLVDEVLADVQRRIDLMFEYRVREALVPALARVADRLMLDAREILATTVRDVVARAVAQEVARRRQRSGS